MNNQRLAAIVSDRPVFHRSETEIVRSFEPEESLLPRAEAQRLASGALVCYAIDKEVLSFIADNVGPTSRTLETGAGCSTLVFALRQSDHTAITPDADEIARIRAYAAEHDIDTTRVKFIAQPSEGYLPQCEGGPLDLVLIDGKHAFPWPIIDWFYTADRLEPGGFMMLDDAEMSSVRLLVEFLGSDHCWKPVHDFGGKTVVFKKLVKSVHDTAWHMQPFVVARQPNRPNASLLARIWRRIKTQRSRLA